jgi:diaminopimelate decarboxylase
MTQLPGHVWPDDAALSGADLLLAGRTARSLAAEFGTPLYLLSESTVRTTMRAFRDALAAAYPAPTRVHYASKALLNTALAQITGQERLGLDVVSAAELAVARRAGIPAAHVHLHGNAKSDLELRRALEWRIGAIVVDTLDELQRLANLSAGLTRPQPILLRLAPDVTAATHAHITTGHADSKFGLPIAALPTALALLKLTPSLDLLGLHAHIGSQIFDVEAFGEAIEVLVAQAARCRDAGFSIREISPGGGMAVAYRSEQQPPAIADYCRTLAGAMQQACARHNLPLPHLTIEPGRSIIARAVVALYSVVGRKLPHWLHVDGGMADNIRPALYQAQYSAFAADRAAEPATTTVSVAGRYCESGDVLLHDVALPALQPGDLLAMPGAGAYTLSMASTYNLVPRPALVLINADTAQLIQRRETEADLLARDLPIAPLQPGFAAQTEE